MCIYIHVPDFKCILAKIFDPFDGDDKRHGFFFLVPYMIGQRHAEHLQFFWAIGDGSGRIIGTL